MSHHIALQTVLQSDLIKNLFCRHKKIFKGTVNSLITVFRVTKLFIDESTTNEDSQYRYH